MATERARKPTASSSQWALVAERGSLLGMRTLVVLYRFGGKWLLAPVLYCVVLYFYATRPATRRYSRLYLQRALGRPVGQSWVWRHHLAFARALMSRVGAWMGRLRIQHVDFPDRDAIRGLKRQGQGAVLLGAHVGNLDMCRAMVEPGQSYRLNIVVHTRHAEKFNRLLQQLNPASQVNLIQVDQVSPETAMLLRSKLTEGEAVVLLADRMPPGNEGRHYEAEFLGDPARFPQGPFWLAILLQAPVFFMTSVENKRKHEIILEPLRAGADKPSRRERALAAEELFHRYVAQLQQLCRNFPLQWFNFYDFWLDDKSAERQGR